MPDNETSLDIVIRTRAELEGAQSVETQLERDIEKARELGQEYAAQEEAGLQSPRAPQSESLTPDTAESELQTAGPDDGVSTPSNAVVPASIPQTSEFPAFDSRGIELQAQAIQEAGEKMRAALEQNGQVTLRGPVRSEDEKHAVEQKAAGVAGEGKVTSELTVKPKS